jgi:DNA-binding beta-propeller fold protein YncE
MIRGARAAAAEFIERSSPTGPARAKVPRIFLRRFRRPAGRAAWRVRRFRQPWAVGLAALAVAGCGSVTDVHDLPPAAEPARSPALTERPAGRLVRIGGEPEGIVADPVTGLVAVGLRDPDELALLDGDTSDIRRRVPLPGAPRHLQLAHPGGPVLVPAEAADALTRVALPQGTTNTTKVGRFPHDAAQAESRVFVGNERGSTVTVLDGDSTRTIAVANQPGGVAAVDSGRAVAVVSVRERVLEVYDSATLNRIASAPAGVGPTHVVAGRGRLIYVVDTTGNGLLVYELEPRLHLTRRLPLLGNPYGIAADPVNQRLWVTTTKTNRLVELADGARPHRLRGFPAVRQPDTVAVDPVRHRVYVTGRAEGVVQILDARETPARTP